MLNKTIGPVVWFNVYSLIISFKKFDQWRLIMRFTDLFWYYGDIAFYLILFGGIYLWILFSQVEKDNHNTRLVNHYGNNKKNESKGALPHHHKSVCIQPNC